VSSWLQLLAVSSILGIEEGQKAKTSGRKAQFVTSQMMFIDASCC
jgi:hypothetical protein